MALGWSLPAAVGTFKGADHSSGFAGPRDRLLSDVDSHERDVQTQNRSPSNHAKTRQSR